jgi:hypothetical protein
MAEAVAVSGLLLLAKERDQARPAVKQIGRKIIDLFRAGFFADDMRRSGTFLPLEIRCMERLERRMQRIRHQPLGNRAKCPHCRCVFAQRCDGKIHKHMCI